MNYIDEQIPQELHKVEVFKTNVQQEADALRIISKLKEQFPGTGVHFDLDDCDKVLRIAYSDTLVKIHDIETIVKQFGFTIEVLV